MCVRDPSEHNASGYDSGNFASSAWGLDRGDSVDVASKRVSIRVDFNVPQDKKDPSVITNTQRIDAALPTIQNRFDRGCTSVILASHLGRPDGSAAEKYSLAPVAKCLEDELKRIVTILKVCAGVLVETACADPSLCSVILFENVRFHVEDEEVGVQDDGFPILSVDKPGWWWVIHTCKEILRLKTPVTEEQCKELMKSIGFVNPGDLDRAANLEIPVTNYSGRLEDEDGFLRGSVDALRCVHV